MKILIVDNCDPNSLDWALRCLEAGHEIRWFIQPDKSGERSIVGDGLIKRVPDWQAHMNWADLVFVTGSTKHLQALQRYSDSGYPIFGPPVDAAKLELDRSQGQSLLERCGIPVPDYTEFSDYDKAITFVEQNADKRFVSKPNGDCDKALSYCSHNAADLVYMLKRWKRNGKLKGQNFILQEFIPGVEMAIGAWFGPNGFSKNLCENWEFKKLMAGDMGPATGEQGTVLRYVRQSKLFDQILKPLGEAFHGIRYVGYVDVNCIIDSRGRPWPLEFTCRPGWPTFQIMQALHEGDPAQWILDLLNGADTLQVKKDVALGVVLAIPDYPYSNITRKEVYDVPIYIEGSYPGNIHFAEVKAGRAPCMDKGRVVEKPIYVTAGDYVLIASGTGTSVSRAKKQAYATLDTIEMPNSPFWRMDIGHRLEEQLPFLQKHGYATGMEY